MITDHVFRKAACGSGHTGEGNNRGQAVIPGMCAWLGTCNRPAGDHVAVASRRIPDQVRDRIFADYMSDMAASHVAARHGVSSHAVMVIVEERGGVVRRRFPSGRSW